MDPIAFVLLDHQDSVLECNSAFRALMSVAA